MNATVKAIIIGSVAVAAIGAITAVLIVIITHGGFNSSNANAIAILIGLITTQIPSILSLVKMQQVDTKLSNGLITEKVSEAVSTPETQSVIHKVVAGALNESVVDNATGVVTSTPAGQPSGPGASPTEGTPA